MKVLNRMGPWKMEIEHKTCDSRLEITVEDVFTADFACAGMDTTFQATAVECPQCGAYIELKRVPSDIAAIALTRRSPPKIVREEPQ